MSKEDLSKADPVVFVSSTAEDLKPHRAAVRDTLLTSGFTPRMQEYFVASGAKPPLPACLAKVDKADVVVALVAHRYGWIPPDQPEGEDKSITWLECQHAANAKKEILAFFVDPDHPWPEVQRDRYAMAKAIGQGAEVLFKVAQDVERRATRLEEFKEWLDARGLRAKFTTPEDLRAKVSEALFDWAKRQPGFSDAPPRRDPNAYLRRLFAETSYIDIRGLQVGTGRVHRFPINDLFITLTAASAGREPSRRGGKKHGPGKTSRVDAEGMRSSVPLEEALTNRRLAVVGDPGSGKSTFLRRIAANLCRSSLEQDDTKANAWLGDEDPPLPILVSLAGLADHIGGQKPSGRRADAATWLAAYAAALSAEGNTGLDEEFFRHRLEDGSALVLLDGLDEAPDSRVRESLSRLIENLVRTYAGCRFVVTCRPAAWVGSTVLPDFERVTIEPLQDAAIQLFFEHWCNALHPESPESAKKVLDELLLAVRSKPEIRHMARNPVMLTALAVVQWNEKRIPEQRADLYESILTWLSRSREQRKGRPSAKRALALLQEVALAMQIHKDGRKTRVPRREAAEAIAGEWPAKSSKDRLATAEGFIVDEELDSGIVVGRGDDLQFWHLTFQEYLAARAVGARPDKDQKRLLGPGARHLYDQEWRETALLLAGVLHQQGRQKVDALFKTLLDGLGSKSSLADRARCAGLLGAMRRDLLALGYEPADPRFSKLMHDVLGIFDRKRSRSVKVAERIEAAEALGQAGDPRLEPDARNLWVDVPAGRFLMGAQKDDPKAPNYDEQAQERESPVHEIQLDAFRIGRYPVTVDEFGRFVDGGGYADESFWIEGGFKKWTEPERWDYQTRHPTRPVVGVSWYEAAAYAAWLGPGNCLPTEAEWERAARGTTGRRYPWGDATADPDMLNCENNVGHPTPVGIYPRGGTPEDIQDIAGNVWEWCHDWYSDYSKTAPPNPRGPGRCSARVLRGGSWFSSRNFARAAYRYNYPPGSRDDKLGFRLLRSSPISG